MRRSYETRRPARFRRLREGQGPKRETSYIPRDMRPKIVSKNELPLGTLSPGEVSWRHLAVMGPTASTERTAATGRQTYRLMISECRRDHAIVDTVSQSARCRCNSQTCRAPYLGRTLTIPTSAGHVPPQRASQRSCALVRTDRRPRSNELWRYGSLSLLVRERGPGSGYREATRVCREGCTSPIRRHGNHGCW
jgi:hypothetical protein